MHEASIAQGLLDTAIASLPKAGDRITKVTIVAGPFSGVEKESLTFYFTELCRGTEADGALLEIKPAPAQQICTKCGHTSDYDGTSQISVTCPQCGSQNRLEGGSALYLDSIEVEED